MFQTYSTKGKSWISEEEKNLIEKADREGRLKREFTLPELCKYEFPPELHGKFIYYTQEGMDGKFLVQQGNANYFRGGLIEKITEAHYSLFSEEENKESIESNYSQQSVQRDARLTDIIRENSFSEEETGKIDNKHIWWTNPVIKERRVLISSSTGQRSNTGDTGSQLYTSESQGIARLLTNPNDFLHYGEKRIFINETICAGDGSLCGHVFFCHNGNKREIIYPNKLVLNIKEVDSIMGKQYYLKFEPSNNLSLFEFFIGGVILFGVWRILVH